MKCECIKKYIRSLLSDRLDQKWIRLSTKSLQIYLFLAPVTLYMAGNRLIDAVHPDWIAKKCF